MKLPIIKAESQRGLIGIESQRGQFHIHSERADLQIETTPTRISAPTPVPELNINQDRMWAAFNGGKPVEFMKRIYSQMPGIALQGIAHIVEKGNRMGDLRIKENPIPDLAFEELSAKLPQIEVFGPASYDNVDIEFTIPKPDTQIDVGRVDIQVQTHKPDIQYERGNVRIYMQQYPKVTFTPPSIDIVT
ncbi:hypothetical protein GXP70_28185 [Paenibacillus lycopersici]|uniref:Uncharacterized protein n=1 Tax=Paenibacillus lycopersici TaxID=2704462 RepID=A0A6C0G675_9BACL|nr:DUF6470 family protein [Paenibacillus lycopersici]QHT63449.1 hypothetical protein GXP70_28185 [Paenibacillus lycopersici]